MAFENVYFKDSVRLYIGLPFYFLDSYFRHIDETLFQIVRAVGNWWEVLLLYLGARDSAVAHFRNGIELEVQKKDLGRLVSVAELANIPEESRRRLGLKISGGSAAMRIKGKSLRLDLEVANAVALEMNTMEHGMISVKGRDVVDVGAYVDDTAMFYAISEGARHVYAFEPFPYLYNVAVKNVRANGLEKKISTYNAAVSGSSGRVSLASDLTSFTMADSVTKGKNKSAVKVVSLDEVARSLKIRDGALKVDCEGCEYGIFRSSSSKTLGSFSLIHVEYHYGYRDIVERLRNEGFMVRYTRPSYNFTGWGSRPMLKGHIIASRK